MANSFTAAVAPNGPDAPATDMISITPDDANPLSDTVRAFYASGAGNVKVTTLAGNDRTIPVGAFQLITCAITKVFATGTTATGLAGYIK